MAARSGSLCRPRRRNVGTAVGRGDEPRPRSKPSDWRRCHGAPAADGWCPQNHHRGANMDWVTDSAQTLGPLYDAIPGGTPAEIKADYLASYAGDRFAESARYVRSYPAELPLLAEILPTIQTPVLLMSGANDELVPVVNAEFLHQRLPKSRMGMLQAGHFAWEEVSDQYADGLLDWIAGGYRELAAASAGS